MLTFVVMPCLDEVALVADAVTSLGFSKNEDPPEAAHLIIVDNGSTDGTLRVLDDLQKRSPESVHLVTEPTRGFVPPRRRGVREAERLARTRGVQPEEVLILQADADTVYRKRYVTIMQAAAAEARGALLEGSTKPPLDFAARHPNYLAAQRLVDDETDPLNAEDEDEVVLDDKVCGYRLSDYLIWGGLFEEFTTIGDAIHAETTRMFIRARLRHCARKLRVNTAGAIPSRRKVRADPRLQYTTVGFPRETSWIEARAMGADRTRDIERFAAAVLQGREPEAVRLRRAHQLALFRYLPALVAEASGTRIRANWPPDVTAALAALPTFSADELANSPGTALLAVLHLIDVRPNLFCKP
ncbi:glycosyltransferase [Sphingomonas molluscorum]|uniref:glycosyltransferase n=1 Tax=Sphingomonas molluscorum TaxID=418184 RepID=UPI0031E182C7